MKTRVPFDLPKTWPFDPAFRGYPSDIIALKEDTSSISLRFAQFVALGVSGIAFVIAWIMNGLSIHLGPFGGSLFLFALIGGPSVAAVCEARISALHRENSQRLTEILRIVKNQVNLEKGLLQRKALAMPVLCEALDDQANLETMKTHCRRHYTPNWHWVRTTLLCRDNHRCCICERRVQLADSVAHHIDAFSEGGSTDFSNLVTICTNCHSVLHPWLDSKLNFFWIRHERGWVYCWKCKQRLDTPNTNVTICSDCGWLYHVDDGACGCNEPSYVPRRTRTQRLR